MEDSYADGQLSCILPQLDAAEQQKSMSASQPKSQKRIDRQARRKQRRQQKAGLASQSEDTARQAPPAKKRKSLPGFLGKHRHEICAWLKHYLFMHVRADDAGVPYIREMDEEQRAMFFQEYIDVAEFIDKLSEYLDEEAKKELSR